VGTAHADAEAVELMASAVEAAGTDAGSASLLGAVDRIAVPQGTWSYGDPARLVAERISAPGARTHFGKLGVPQQTLINEALRAIVSGHSDVAVVVGGEARARERRAQRAGTVATETAQNGVVPDVVMDREDDFIVGPEIAAGLTQPVLQYALIENALGAAEEQRTTDQAAAVADLWERFNVCRPRRPRTDRWPFRITNGMPVSGRSIRRRPLSCVRWRRPGITTFPSTAGCSPSSASTPVMLFLSVAAVTSIAGPLWAFSDGRRSSASGDLSMRSNTSRSTRASRRPSGFSNENSDFPSRARPR
jgi:hypothetical protein